MAILMDKSLESDIKKGKKALRRTMREVIATIPAERRASDSQAIFAEIEKLQQWRDAKTIAIYDALSDELPTREVIRRWAATKRVVLPVVNGDDMEFFEYSDGCATQVGAFGICEPTGTKMVAPSEIDLMVVPGVAFDTECNRLGRGKGYYDKYLSRCDSYNIGVCSDEQLIDTSIPCDEYDHQMSMVVTAASPRRGTSRRVR